MKKSEKIIILSLLLIFLIASFLPVILIDWFYNLPKDRVLSPCSYFILANSYGGVAENVTLIVPIIKYGDGELNFTISKRVEYAAEPSVEEVEILNQTYLRIHFEKFYPTNHEGGGSVVLIPTPKVEISNLEKIRIGNANKTKIYVYFENAGKITIDAYFDINEDYYITVLGKKIKVTQAVTHGLFTYCRYHAVVTKNESGKWIEVPVEYKDVWWLYD